MDAEQPPARTSRSLSAGRAAAVLVGFVVAVAVLVAWGTRPSVSTTVPAAVPTTAPTTGGTTTTAAPGGGGPTTTPTTAAATTTTAARSHKGATTTTTVPNSSVSVVVANGTSTSGLAAHYTAVLGSAGWAMKTPVDATTAQATSAVYYAPGFQQPAQHIASSIGIRAAAVAPITSAVPVNGISGIDVVVVIGQDLAATTATTATTTG